VVTKQFHTDAFKQLSTWLYCLSFAFVMLEWGCVVFIMGCYLKAKKAASLIPAYIIALVAHRDEVSLMSMRFQQLLMAPRAVINTSPFVYSRQLAQTPGTSWFGENRMPYIPPPPLTTPDGQHWRHFVPCYSNSPPVPPYPPFHWPKPALSSPQQHPRHQTYVRFLPALHLLSR
jgi:hypothetical protein